MSILLILQQTLLWAVTPIKGWLKSKDLRGAEKKQGRRDWKAQIVNFPEMMKIQLWLETKT